MSNHTVESVARVFACRTLEHRLVLLGFTRHHEAPVDGLPHWRKLRSGHWHTFISYKGLVRMFAEPGCGLNILLNERADFVVRRGIRRLQEWGCRMTSVALEWTWGARGGLKW